MNNAVSEAIKKHGKERSSLLAVLQYVVSKDKWLSEGTMEDVAKEFDMSAAEVYGVASFYSFLDTKPRGKFVIRVCRSISCDMAGKENVSRELSKFLRIKNGETTPDGLFTLLETNCMGWCHKGPAMLVNDDVYTELTSAKAVDVITSYTNRKN